MVLPVNLDAEQALLGAVLVNNAVVSTFAAPLEPGHFYDSVHARIYKAIADMIARGDLANPITVKTFFEADDTLKEIGGTAYLARLAGAATTIANARGYAEVIRDTWQRREIIRLAEDMINDASQPRVDYSADSLISDVALELDKLAAGTASRTSFTFGQALDEAAQLLQGKVNGTIEKSDIPTGFKEVDQRFSPLGPARLVVVAGRPGMGKTAVALALALGMAQRGIPLGFMSQEMARIELANRVLSSIVYDSGAVSFFHIGRGEVSHAQLDRIFQAIHTQNGLPFYGDDASGLTLQDISARARQLKAQRKIRVLIVDYLGLMNAGDRYRGQRVNEVGELSTGLKRLAKELGICIIALHQLSRDVEKRDDKRPVLSDLRDSGNIEQDADVVCFLFREVYYLEQSLRASDPGTADFIKFQDAVHAKRNALEMIFAKNRGGPTGTADMWIDVSSNVMRGLE